MGSWIVLLNIYLGCLFFQGIWKVVLLRHNIPLWCSLEKKLTLALRLVSTLVFTIFTDSVHHFGINHLPILSLSFMATVGKAKEWGRDDYYRSDRYKISYWAWLLWTGRGGETIYLAAFPNQLLRVCLSHFGLCVLPSETIPYRHSSVWPSCSCSWPHCRGQV